MPKSKALRARVASLEAEVAAWESADNELVESLLDRLEALEAEVKMKRCRAASDGVEQTILVQSVRRLETQLEEALHSRDEWRSMVEELQGRQE